jgi:hypothetical protein
VIEDFKASVSQDASVLEESLTPRLRHVEFVPANPNAARASVIIGKADEVIVEVIVTLGTETRFELGATEEDCRLLRDLLEAAREGRLEETRDRLGTKCVVYLADGREMRSRTAHRPVLKIRRTATTRLGGSPGDVRAACRGTRRKRPGRLNDTEPADRRRT